MSKLIDCYAPFIDATLVIAERLRSETLAPIGVRDQLNEVLAGARQNAITGGTPEAIADSAAFAVIAWADELLVTVEGFGWGSKVEPLQKQHFRTLNAGNEFFQRLRALNSESIALADIYYLILCLGFKGQYEGVPNELIKIRDQLALQSESRPQNRQLLAQDPLYPQPYRIADPGRVVVPVNRSRRWLLAVAAVLLLLIGGAVWYFLTLPPSIDKITADVQALVQKYKCADLNFNIDTARKVSVLGYVSSTTDAAELPVALRRINGVQAVETTLDVHVAPICEVLLLTKPYVAETPSEQAPTVKINPKGGGTHLGNKLIVDVQMSNFDGNIYVDLIDFEGNVAHFLPNEIIKQTFRPARNKFTIGEDRLANRTFELSPPAGEHLIIVFAVPQVTPLFTPLRPEIETAATYLPVFRAALADLKSRNAKIAVGQPLLFTSTP